LGNALGDFVTNSSGRPVIDRDLRLNDEQPAAAAHRLLMKNDGLEFWRNQRNTFLLRTFGFPRNGMRFLF
jgi:hypothetical protein